MDGKVLDAHFEVRKGVHGSFLLTPVEAMDPVVDQPVEVVAIGAVGPVGVGVVLRKVSSLQPRAQVLEPRLRDFDGHRSQVTHLSLLVGEATRRSGAGYSLRV